jgi:hypothetical protein
VGNKRGSFGPLKLGVNLQNDAEKGESERRKVRERERRKEK